MTDRLNLAAALAALVGLTACSAYEAKPPSPAAFAAKFDARPLAAPEGGAWTDEALLAEAVARSPAVVQAAAAYRSALAAAKAARTPPPISLLLVAEYSRDAGGSTPWLASGLLTLPLDVGARRQTRLTTADLTALQALYDYAEALWTARSALVRAHADRQAADREIGLAEAAVALRQTRLAALERRIAAGEDARAIGLLAEADLAAARRRLQGAQALRVQADSALAKALGSSERVTAALALAPLADTVATPSADALSAGRREASLRRRDVLRAVADYEIAEQALKLEVAKQYPDIQLGPGYTYERGQHKLPFDLNLTLPPRDLNRANIAAAEAKRAEAGTKLDAAQAAVLGDVDRSAAALANARAGLDLALTQDLPIARRTADQARKGVLAGELDRTDQQAAEAAALDAEFSGVEAWRTARDAAADLEDALRLPSPAESAVLETAVKQAGDHR